MELSFGGSGQVSNAPGKSHVGYHASEADLLDGAFMPEYASSRLALSRMPSSSGSVAQSSPLEQMPGPCNCVMGIQARP